MVRAAANCIYKEYCFNESCLGLLKLNDSGKRLQGNIQGFLQRQHLIEADTILTSNQQSQSIQDNQNADVMK